MMLFDRRVVGISSAAAVATLMSKTSSDDSTISWKENLSSLSFPPLASLSGVSLTLPALPLDDVVQCICQYTPKSFRSSVKKSGGKFLYRGEELNNIGDYGGAAFKETIKNANPLLLPSSLAAWVRAPEPDLLLPETYNNDPMALSYFKCLEHRLVDRPNSQGRPEEIVVKPSAGHIGTADPRQAAPWGSVVSVWPLGNSISYVWPFDRTMFFPYPATKSNRRMSNKYACLNDKLIINDRLTKALRTNREVLFASWFQPSHQSNSPAIAPPSAFLIVPVVFDDKLRNALEQQNYGF